MPTRRSWMTQAAGVALLAQTKIKAQEYKFPNADIKLGIASYSFRNFSREQAIQMTKELGTPYLNVKDFHLKLDSTPDQIAGREKGI